MPAKGYKKEKTILKCEHCSYTTVRKCFMKDHERVHTGERPFSCDTCGKGFTQKSNLKQHMKVHGSGATESYKCDQCDFVTKWKTSLQAHKRWHKGEKPYKCNICGRTFSQMTHCKTHQKESHFNIRHFQCDVCSKTFKRQDHLIRHQRFHSQERNYECDICHKKFIEERYVIIHKRIHLGESSKCFKCDQCSYKTRYKQGLDIHYRTHTGVRPYQCKDCSKAFVTSQSLRLHNRMVHQGMAGKIFKCTDCDFSTANKQSLKNHSKRIHLGIKNTQDLSCEYCDVKYKFRCSLVKHKKKMHAREYAAAREQRKQQQVRPAVMTANIIGTCSVVTEMPGIKAEPRDNLEDYPGHVRVKVECDEEQMEMSSVRIVNQPDPDGDDDEENIDVDIVTEDEQVLEKRPKKATRSRTKTAKSGRQGKSSRTKSQESPARKPRKKQKEISGSCEKRGETVHTKDTCSEKSSTRQRKSKLRAPVTEEVTRNAHEQATTYDSEQEASPDRLQVKVTSLTQSRRPRKRKQTKKKVQSDIAVEFDNDDGEYSTDCYVMRSGDNVTEHDEREPAGKSLLEVDSEHSVSIKTEPLSDQECYVTNSTSPIITS